MGGLIVRALLQNTLLSYALWGWGCILRALCGGDLYLVRVDSFMEISKRNNILHPDCEGKGRIALDSRGRGAWGRSKG